jgi:hypothetical protein
MRRYHAWQFVKALIALDAMECDCKEACQQGSRDVPVPSERIKNWVAPLLANLERQCKTIELTTAHARIDNPELRLGLDRGITFDQLRTQVKVLRDAIETDLMQRRFASVESWKAKIHDDLAKDWGEVWRKCPSAKEDTERAVDCYALEQDTACIFHLMRVAEIGFRTLAKKLRVTITHKRKAAPIEYGDWEKVLTEIKNKITQARLLPAGPKRQTKLDFYSDVADHCTFMKDMWRNPVSHGRKAYNDSEAKLVLDRVRDFMHFLAKNL